MFSRKNVLERCLLQLTDGSQNCRLRCHFLAVSRTQECPPFCCTSSSTYQYPAVPTNTHQYPPVQPSVARLFVLDNFFFSCEGHAHHCGLSFCMTHAWLCPVSSSLSPIGVDNDKNNTNLHFCSLCWYLADLYNSFHVLTLAEWPEKSSMTSNDSYVIDA